jgi:hypothetical protein
VPKSVLYVPIFWEFFAPEFDERGRFTKDYLQKLENYLKEFAEPPSYNIGNIILGALGGTLAGSFVGVGADILLGNQSLNNFKPDPLGRPSLLPFFSILGGGGLGALLGYLKKPDNKDILRYKKFLEQAPLYKQNKLSPEDQNKFEKEVFKILKKRFYITDEEISFRRDVLPVLAVFSLAPVALILANKYFEFINPRIRGPGEEAPPPGSFKPF